jgi:hypothetical protein
MVDDPSGTEMAPGLAALAICESLLTSLQELKIIGAQEVVDILKDASSGAPPGHNCHRYAEGA